MKVACSACGSSYAIADRKISGRRVKVRCKSCGGAIVVDGREVELVTSKYADVAAAAVADTSDQDPTNYSDDRPPWTGAASSWTAREVDPATQIYRPDDDKTHLLSKPLGSVPPGPEKTLRDATTPDQEGEWHVLVDDGDQRLMTRLEIATAITSSLVTKSTLVWKEGMREWAPVAELPELATLTKMNEPTVAAMTRPLPAPSHAARVDQFAEPARDLFAHGAEASNASPPKPRREPARPAPPSRASKPGAPPPPPPPLPPSAPDAKESSGMFSLSALKATREPGPPKVDRASAEDLLGLGSAPAAARRPPTLDPANRPRLATPPPPAVAPRTRPALPTPAGSVPAPTAPSSLEHAAPARPAKPVRTAVAPSTAAAAPSVPAGAAPMFGVTADLAAARTSPIASASGAVAESGGSRHRAWFGIGVLLALGLVAGGVYAGLALTRVAVPAPQQSGAPEPVPAPTLAAATAGTTTAPATMAASAAPTAPVRETADEPALPVRPDERRAEPRDREPDPERTLEATPERTAEREPAEEEPAKAPKLDLGDEANEPDEPASPEEPAKPDEPAPPEVEPPKGPFDKNAARAALESAAASAPACKRPDGPTGSGRAAVTFAPSGRVTTASISGGDFGGTAVGGCIASLFRRARVPAFSGSPITVSKSFTIP